MFGHRIWLRGLLVIGLLFPVAGEAGPPSRFRHRDPVIKPLDRESAAERLAAIRNYDPGADLILMFEMVERRRRDDARVIGLMESTRVGGSQVIRLSEIKPVESDGDRKDGYEVNREWRIRGGAVPRVEINDGSPQSAFETIPQERWMDPLVDGFSHTPFDLVMPFLYWSDYEYEGPDRVNGRSSHLFRFTPPPEWSSLLVEEGVSSVRVVIDRQFNAPLLIEYLASDETVVRSLRAASFREVDDTWIVGTLESRDYVRDLRTRLNILGGGEVSSALMAVGAPPRERIRVPFAELGLEWF